MAGSKAFIAATQILVTQWPFVLVAVLATAAAWVSQLLLIKDPLSKFPLVGPDTKDKDKLQVAWEKGAQKLYRAGYEKFKTELFRVKSSRNSQVIVVAPRFLSELKDLPDDHLSFAERVEETMHSKFTGIRGNETIMPYIVKRNLTPALNRLNPTIAEEVDQALRDELPPCKEFTQIDVHDHLLRIIAKVSGRVFVGPEVCRTEEYVDLSINFTMEASMAAKAISSLKSEERPAKAPHLDEVKKLAKRRQNTLALFRPMITARRKAQTMDFDYVRPVDLMQWIIDDGQAKFGEHTDEDLAGLQLTITAAAIHTTTMVATNAFYTLAVMPELFPELREEISTVLKEHGTYTTAALQKMKKLDSFLREVTRQYPLNFVGFERKVMKPITLSNGQLIPAGVIIQTPANGYAHDPDTYPNPDQFDAFRSYRLREQAGLTSGEKASADALNQMVAVSPNHLIFGFGRHACPGRFFAINEIKMIIGDTLLKYDMKTIDGSKERYKNVQFYEWNAPDKTQKLLFKRVAF